ncbi:hypothetical protein CR513_19721, partial [Mucuna pruriens]
MNEEIGTNYLYYSTVKELWDNVSQMYSDLQNQSQVYELTLQLGENRQGEDSLTKYFNCHKQIWQDLDLFNDHEWKSPEDCKQYKKLVDVSRVFKFLTDLNIEFDEVRDQILGRNPIPLIGEVFAKVRREESQRQVMLGKVGVGITKHVEGSTLAILDAQFSQKSWVGDKNNLCCDYRGRTHHTRANCYKLHGRPNNGKANKFGEHNIPTMNEAESSFSKEQLHQLLKLLKLGDQNPGKMIGTAKEMNGLYYFDETTLGNKKAHVVQNFTVKLVTWLKTIVSHFPTKSYYASKPFYLFHIDVWSPSEISTMFGKK